MQLIYILGRQSAIGLAELESVYGAAAVSKISTHALINTDHPVDFTRLGSSIKAATVVGRVTSTDIAIIQRELRKITLSHLASMPAEGKIKLGLSSYGLNLTPQKLNNAGLQLKKAIRDKGRSVRHAPNTEAALSSAQVYHNKLTQPLGIELVLVRDGNATIVAITTDVQDINSYTFRDRSRPKRDARVGMLPPKLAQTIINLAIGDTPTAGQPLILDPFCGTGVVLQEAILMGYRAAGTDIDTRMVQYSEANIQWLGEKFPDQRGSLAYIEIGDATEKQWRDDQHIDAVACESYLGRPFTNEPDKEILFTNRNDCDTIIRKFLENIHPQLESGTRLCIGVPAWFAHGTTYHLKTLDYLEEIGYNRISFVHADKKSLIYHREDQVVGRELVVMRRN